LGEIKMPKPSKELVDLDLDKKHETEKALLLSDGTHEEWIAKSVVEDHGDGCYTMPVWIAREKGWL
jgi:hypothetical protein